MGRPPNPYRTLIAYRTLIGRTAVDRSGVRIGQIRQVIVDEVTGRPEWVVIATGVLGARQKLVPIAADDLRDAVASRVGDGGRLAAVTIPADDERVRSAPRVELVDGQPTQSAEEALYRHYQMIADEPPTAEAANGSGSMVADSAAPMSDPAPPGQGGPLAEIARAASGVLYDLRWLDRMIEKLAVDALEQDQDRQ